jgi:hypothetical protein
VRRALFPRLLAIALFPACTPSPPPRDVPIATPVKPVVSVAIPPVVSAPPNPPPPIASAETAAPPEAPDPDPKLALGNGTDVVVVFSGDASSGPPELALELRRENKVVLRREGWDAITHFDLKKLQFCETWTARMGREPLGTIDAVRVSLVCRTGEDYQTSEEVALLVKPDNLETIWAGLGDRYINSMDSCIEGRHVHFQIISPKTLEKTIVEETRWVDQVITDDVKDRLKRECKLGSKRRIERVKLP